jgi:plastocyanin
MSLRITGAVLAAGATLAACGGTKHLAAPAGNTRATLPPAAVATQQVTVDNFAFMPAAITVKAGSTVTWTNKDEEPHSVVSASDGIRSQTLAGDALSYSHTFRTAGTYSYNCSIHPFMHGTVVVTQ